MKTSGIAANAPAQKQMLLLIAVALLIPVVMLAIYLSRREIASVDPTVSIERAQNNDPSNQRSIQIAPTLADEGEVYRTANRLREASAVALAAALYTTGEQINRRYPQSADAVVVGMRTIDALPPGITVADSAMLQSHFAKLFLRFKLEPLMIEVLSQPRSREDGPALMVRIPGSGPDGEHGSVFIADRLGDIELPSPFTSASDCARAGWIDQPINQTDTPQEQERQLRLWLAARRPR